MTPEEILKEVQRLSRMAMDYDSQRERIEKLPFQDRREYYYPDYYPGYREAAEDYDAIMIHADKSIFPQSLFAKRAPAQDPSVNEWLRNNYKNVTQSVYMEFRNTVSRGLNDDNWSIDYEEDESEITVSGLTFQHYVENGIRDYGSIESFFKNILIDIKLKDAMGVIAVKPAYIPTVVTEDGERVISSTELIEPRPYYYTTKQVVGFKSGEIAFIELYERSVVNYGNAEKRMGRIYEVYDKNFIYHVTQIGKYIENQFAITTYYQHNWNRLPVERNKGIAQIVHGEIFYQSHFLFSTGYLDLVSQNYTYLQAMIAKCAFPVPVMIGEDCEFEQDGKKCEGGWIRWFDEADGYHSQKCPKCDRGLVSRLSAFSTLLLKPATRLEGEGDNAFKHKPLEYISPDDQIMRFVGENCIQNKEDARKVLHLHTSNSVVKGTENMTATGMAIDSQATTAFVMPIIFQAFQLYEFIHAAIGWQRYGKRFKEPTIVYPQSIEIGTAKDILELISYMQTNNMPKVAIQGEVTRYIQSTYYTDKKTTAFYKLILQSDRLLIMDTADIVIGTKNNTIETWEWVLHDSVQFFIAELLREDEKFYEKDIKDQISEVQRKAKEKAAEVKPDQVSGEDLLIRDNVE